MLGRHPFPPAERSTRVREHRCCASAPAPSVSAVSRCYCLGASAVSRERARAVNESSTSVSHHDHLRPPLDCLAAFIPQTEYHPRGVPLCITHFFFFTYSFLPPTTGCLQPAAILSGARHQFVKLVILTTPLSQYYSTSSRMLTLPDYHFSSSKVTRT